MNNIISNDLQGVDLNLLVALEALLIERSVTRAASRLGVGQPAMSSSLARLRRMFDDELLTRVPGGMQPTPRASALGENLRAALAQIRGLIVRDTAFDPRIAATVFRIGVLDSVEVMLIPTVAAMLRREAPNVRLRLRSLDRVDVLAELDADRLDMAVGVFRRGQIHHKRRLIHTDGHLAIYDPSALVIQGRLTIDHYASTPLVTVDGPDPDPVVEALVALGVTPTVALSTPHLLGIPAIVASAPVLATVHASVARHFSRTMGLAVASPPDDLDLAEVPLSIIWHSSNDAAPAHRWMRDIIGEALLQARREAGPAACDQVTRATAHDGRGDGA